MQPSGKQQASFGAIKVAKIKKGMHYMHNLSSDTPGITGQVLDIKPDNSNNSKIVEVEESGEKRSYVFKNGKKVPFLDKLRPYHA